MSLEYIFYEIDPNNFNFYQVIPSQTQRRRVSYLEKGQ